METLKKAMGQDRQGEYESIIAPVKAFLAKSECQSFLNKLCIVQAFYNNINLTTLQISNVDGQPTVQNLNDRKVVIKQFQKHIIQIFEALNKQVSDKNFDDFMGILAENIKNLGARIKQLDKKVEKRVVQMVMKSLKD